MSSRKMEETPEITARPKSLTDDLVYEPTVEPGLSVTPEELGQVFLSDAMEQANFESARGGDTPEIDITGPSPTDGALTGANWENGSIWEHTINMSLQEGSLEEVRTEASPEGNAQVQGLEGDEAGGHNVDVTSANIHEASLLDYETDELGEVASPEVDADEQESGARRHASAENAAAVGELPAVLPSGRHTRGPAATGPRRAHSANR